MMGGKNERLCGPAIKNLLPFVGISTFAEHFFKHGCRGMCVYRRCLFACLGCFVVSITTFPPLDIGPPQFSCKGTIIIMCPLLGEKPKVLLALLVPSLFLYLSTPSHLLSVMKQYRQGLGTKFLNVYQGKPPINLS